MMKNMNEQLLVKETQFFTGNGYIGIRGNYEEGYPEGYDSVRGTYINGFYDIVDITYGESAYGFPKTAQKMANIIDAQTIEIYLNDEKFSMFEGEVIEEARGLDIYSGVYTRKVHWMSPKGSEVVITFSRMTSFAMLELALIDVQVESRGFTGKLTIKSKINGNVENYTNPNDPRVASGHSKILTINKNKLQESVMQLSCLTKRSKLEVCASVYHSLEMSIDYQEGCYSANYEKNITTGEISKMTKYIIYTDSIRCEEPLIQGERLLKEAIHYNMEDHLAKQKEFLNSFWKYSKIEVKGYEQIEEALNYSVYQLMASAGKDAHSNICAKGLSGEGYEGHYFWDTEVYMLPFFTLTNPKVAKSLMKFRYETLDLARARAKEMGHHYGAKIPWRTISGTECSAYFPAGSAQYHINADVAFSYIQFYLLHDDLSFMKEFGFELLVETGRIWMDMGLFTKEGSFMIHDVTGPDEYTAIVNNNYYTNAMAQYHLNWIVKIAKRLELEATEVYRQLSDSLGLTKEELLLMQKAAEAMYFEFDKELGVYMQDDSFKNKPVWDFEGTPKDHYPLLLHYHPLVIYRHKVLKQADTILAMLLLDNVTSDVFEKSYDYYEPLTTHDSSLSPCVHSMAAASIGRSETAFEFFNQTIRLDLDNLHHNTKDGLHIANAGGAYMTIVYGFGGFRIKEDGVHLNPSIPKEFKHISFNINRQGSLIHVVLADKIRIKSLEHIKIWIYKREYEFIGLLEVDYE